MFKFILLLSLFFSLESNAKTKIAVVDSYHPQYLWSKETHRGFAKGFLEAKFFDNQAQVDKFWSQNKIETKKAIFRRFWMNTKRKKSQSEIAASTFEISAAIKKFQPSIIFLGDDNAANYIGNQFLDTQTPVIFWGVNGTPLKYNLLNSKTQPGRNVSGVYQAGYFVESLNFLKELAPHIRSFAILADDTTTGRTKAKLIQSLSKRGKITLALKEVVVTNSFENWKKSALRLSKTVDAFFILNHQGLVDKNKKSIDMMTVGKWYLTNIKIPECSDEKQFVQEGMLATVDDSGFNQGYSAAQMGLKFILDGRKPASTPAIAPPPGPRTINIQRLKSLGIKLKENIKIDEKIKTSIALQ